MNWQAYYARWIHKGMNKTNVANLRQYIGFRMNGMRKTMKYSLREAVAKVQILR
jgi:hypothetical protein